MEKHEGEQYNDYQSKKLEQIKSLVDLINKKQINEFRNSFLETHEKHFDSSSKYYESLEKYSFNVRYEVDFK